MKMITTILFILFALLFATTVMAEEVKYAWDHNDPLPEGYRLFLRYGTEAYDYTAPVWQGIENSTTSIPVDKSRVFHAVVRAYVGEYESADSNEVSWAVVPSPNGLGVTVLQVTQ
jgi:hypothetical protein